MNKVLIIVDNGCIYFSKYNRKISETNLNNTNVINTKNLKFTEEYIKENLELVSTFINLIVLKFRVNKVVLKDIEIAETVVALVNTLSSIKYINFSEDSCLNYTISSLLLENKNLEKIECYNLPEIMFYRFDVNIIKTRSKILSESSFFKYNKINTYSDIYNKKTITIPKLFNEADIDDLKYFFETNKNLKRVEFKPYNRINLQTISRIIKNNNLRNINVIIHEDESTTKEILNDIKFFDGLNKKFGVNIKIKYSKKYKDKNKIKQLNLELFRTILITTIIISIILFIAYKLLEKNSIEDVDKNMENVNKAMEEVIIEESDVEITQIEEPTDEKNNYVSSYYKDYSKVYNELLNINSDTVGWLSVNNTNVNYPVVQASDNDYYLNHAYDKTKNIAGWLFVDYKNDMDNISQNTIIYGHSFFSGGIMFSTLKNVLDNSWHNNDNNLNINFSIKGQNYTWRIFSIYTIKETNDYLQVGFNNEESYLKFINKIKSRSIKDFNVEVNSDSKILTLSTCYKDDKHRLVIHAYMQK